MLWKCPNRLILINCSSCAGKERQQLARCYIWHIFIIYLSYFLRGQSHKCLVRIKRQMNKACCDVAVAQLCKFAKRISNAVTKTSSQNKPTWRHVTTFIWIHLSAVFLSNICWHWTFSEWSFIWNLWLQEMLTRLWLWDQWRQNEKRKISKSYSCRQSGQTTEIC